METQAQYLLSDERLNFCIKRLKSFKISRVLSLIGYLFVNYLFIFALFGFDNYRITLAIYIIFSLCTSAVTYLITSKAIKRYANIIKEIIIRSDKAYEITTIQGNVIIIEKGKYHIEQDILTENRYKKFKVFVIVIGKKKFSFVPEWFMNTPNDLNHLF